MKKQNQQIPKMFTSNFFDFKQSLPRSHFIQSRFKKIQEYKCWCDERLYLGVFLTSRHYFIVEFQVLNFRILEIKHNTSLQIIIDCDTCNGWNGQLPLARLKMLSSVWIWIRDSKWGRDCQHNDEIINLR